MKIKNITIYKGRYCAELEEGNYLLTDGSMKLLFCRKVEKGMEVLKRGIIGGMMMCDEDDFRWCVEHLNQKELI